MIERPHDLFRSSVRLDLVSAEGRELSNWVFVLDLVESRDASTAVRRAVKKANATAAGVELALAMLREMGDEKALVEFFWFLNVKGMPEPGRHSLARAGLMPGPYVPKEPLDLHQQLQLDTALDYFWRRHVRRLVRLVDAPSKDAVPVALHLLAALHGGLDVQTAHVLARVRAQPTMAPDEWRDARLLMDRALGRYREVAEAVAEIDGSVTGRAIALLRENVAELRRGRDLIVAWRTAIEGARGALHIAVPLRKPVPAEYFDGNVLRRWSEYERRLDQTIGQLVARLAA